MIDLCWFTPQYHRSSAESGGYNFTTNCCVKLKYNSTNVKQATWFVKEMLSVSN